MPRFDLNSSCILRDSRKRKLALPIDIWLFFCVFPSFFEPEMAVILFHRVLFSVFLKSETRNSTLNRESCGCHFACSSDIKDVLAIGSSEKGEEIEISARKCPHRKRERGHSPSFYGLSWYWALSLSWAHWEKCSGLQWPSLPCIFW